MTIGAEKSGGRLATTRDTASIPPADAPMTTSWESEAVVTPSHPDGRGLAPIAPRPENRLKPHEESVVAQAAGDYVPTTRLLARVRASTGRKSADPRLDLVLS